MARTFDDGRRMGLIRAGLAAVVGEINTTRRTWYANYRGTRCYHNGRRWDLSSNGVAADEPGSTLSWVEKFDVINLEAQPWQSGNTFDRVETVINGDTWIMRLREGRNRTINPAEAGGPAHWMLDNPADFTFKPELGPYMAPGMVTYHVGRLYELLSEYQSAPTPVTDLQWRDIFDDAITPQLPTVEILSMTGGYQL